jgi:hypothetical protein
MMLDLDIWRAWLSSYLFDAQTKRDERGDITQTVIIVALFAAAAIAICTIIITKFTGKASSIPTE